MNKINLLMICLCLSVVTYSQSFQEICESATTNGTIVNCQYFNDTLYATGFFTFICDEPASYVAKWENDEWQPAAIELSDPGHSLRVIDDKLYIAKYVESIDSNWVYVYDNNTLEKVGQGVYLTTASGFSELPNIYDVIEYNGRLIACGEFDRVGSASIQGVMEWDGSNWGPLDTGLSGSIPGAPPVLFPHQMMVHDGELYVVGNFRSAGGVEVNGIAKWDGTSWTNLGAGFNNTVYSITVFNGEIIVGGSFTESNGTPLNRIAKWDGTNWLALDFGFTQSSPNDFTFIHTLKVIDGILYMGGGLKEITYSDGSTEACNGIVSYTGSLVNTFMGGVPNTDIEAICPIEGDQLLIGGGVFGSGYSGIADISTSVIEAVTRPDVAISPNPFVQSIMIDTPVEIAHYEVINELGQVLSQGPFETNIQLQLPAGLYFLKLAHRGNSYSIHKIIKI